MEVTQNSIFIIIRTTNDNQAEENDFNGSSESGTGIGDSDNNREAWEANQNAIDANGKTQTDRAWDEINRANLAIFNGSGYYSGFGYGIKLEFDFFSYKFGFNLSFKDVVGKEWEDGNFHDQKQQEISANFSGAVFQAGLKYDRKKGLQNDSKFSPNGVGFNPNGFSLSIGAGLNAHIEATGVINFGKGY